MRAARTRGARGSRGGSRGSRGLPWSPVVSRIVIAGLVTVGSLSAVDSVAPVTFRGLPWSPVSPPVVSRCSCGLPWSPKI